MFRPTPGTSAPAASRRCPLPCCSEIGLQPCGWLAAYLGSALTSPIDLSFRNLDGNAVQHRAVTPQSGTLTTKVKITRVASSGGMIIQGYDFEISDVQGPVYTGDTVFGFFSKEALAQQVGVRDAKLYQPSAEEIARGERFAYPAEAPFPEKQLRMVDRIELFVPDGGPQASVLSAAAKAGRSGGVVFQGALLPGSGLPRLPRPRIVSATAQGGGGAALERRCRRGTRNHGSQRAPHAGTIAARSSRATSR